MQDVGESWLMVSLTKSPVLVALVETFGSLPVVLLALPAGALADVIDRRRLLLITQTWMLAVATVMGVSTLSGVMTPWLLLLLTFTLGLGAAINSPVWQAIIPELVPQRQLPQAITLTGVAFNVSRAVGPAIAGFLVAAAGPGFVFLLNAVSFVGVIAVVYRWQRASRDKSSPPEHLFGAMRAGVRYVRHAPEVQAVLLRTAAFMFCASGLWALLPVRTRNLGLSAIGYGIFLGCIGSGAILGATFISRLRQSVSNNLLVAGASIVFAGATAALAHARWPLLIGPTMLLAGVAWIAAISNLNTAAQAAAPAWARGRVLSTYTLVFMGSLALGSAVWGVVATRYSVALSLDIAAAGLVLVLMLNGRYQLVRIEELSLAPWVHWPEPVVVVQPEPERGPVLVVLEYLIDANRAAEFRKAMRDLRRVRRRDGASRWGLYSDPSQPGRFVETFIVESWAEHMRQHRRITQADRAIEEKVLAFHLPGGVPKTTHLIAEHVPR